MPKFKQGALCVLIAAAFAGTAVAAPCNGPTGSAPTIVPDAPLTLTMALMQIRHASPDVRRAALETRASAAEADQAGRRLNPSIGLEIENFSGTGPLNGFDQTETTLAIEQTFQLGGKRAKRERAARARAALADAECRVILRETELEAALLYHDLIAATELAALAADAEIDQRRYELAALWGSSTPVFAPPRAILSDESEILSKTRGLDEHPALAAAKAGATARDAEQDAARAAGIPDVTVSAGVRQFEETGDNALLVGVTAVEARLWSQQQAAAARVRAAEARLTLLEQEALPAARSAYDASVEGYAAGRFDLTSTLDTRKGLIEASVSVIDARRTLNADLMRLKSLIGAAPFNGDFQ